MVSTDARYIRTPTAKVDQARRLRELVQCAKTRCHLAVGGDDNAVATSTGELQAANFAQKVCVRIVADLRTAIDRDAEKLFLDSSEILFPLRRLTAASPRHSRARQVALARDTMKKGVANNVFNVLSCTVIAVSYSSFGSKSLTLYDCVE